MIRTDVRVAECRESDRENLSAALLSEFGKHVRFRPWVMKGWLEVLVLEVTKRDQEIRMRAFAVGFVSGRESLREAVRNELEQRESERAARDARALPPVLLDEVGGLRGQSALAG